MNKSIKFINWSLANIHYISQLRRMTDILIKNRNTSAFIEQIIKTTLDQMLQHEHNGDYVEAEKCRLKYQQGKKDLQNKKLEETNIRHKNQKRQMDNAHNQEMRNMNVFWQNKLNQFAKEGRRLIEQLEDRHDSDLSKTRQTMEGQLSLKVKESSQLLNLRKMQEHMAKQKNYVEANRVQQRVNKLYEEQRLGWMKQRELKIEAALTNLKCKQQTQANNLKKRIKTGEQQQRKDWHMQEIRIVQKYQNLTKQLKAQQERQVLSLKGQFKSKGGSSSPSMKYKNSMSSTSSSR